MIARVDASRADDGDRDVLASYSFDEKDVTRLHNAIVSHIRSFPSVFKADS